MLSAPSHALPAVMTRRVLAYVLAAAFAAPLAACKQGEGGVCQVNDDCEDGLTCNAGTKRCQSPGSVAFDASFPDAHTPDARPADAGMPDAGPK
jgi:hypothetical protein